MLIKNHQIQLYKLKNVVYHIKSMWKTAKKRCGKPQKMHVENHKKVLYFPHCFIKKAHLTLSKQFKQTTWYHF